MSEETIKSGGFVLKVIPETMPVEYYKKQKDGVSILDPDIQKAKRYKHLASAEKAAERLHNNIANDCFEDIVVKPQEVMEINITAQQLRNVLNKARKGKDADELD